MAPKGNTLLSGQSLAAGDHLQSPNGRFSAYLRFDGDFSVCWGVPPDALVGAMWSSDTAGSVPDLSEAEDLLLVMQADANLVLYRHTQAIWSSGTARQQGDYYAVIQNDGNFVLYEGTPENRGNSYWDSHTYETVTWLHNGATYESRALATWNRAESAASQRVLRGRCQQVTWPRARNSRVQVQQAAGSGFKTFRTFELGAECGQRFENTGIAIKPNVHPVAGRGCW